jgi:hypothetical protein
LLSRFQLRSSSNVQSDESFRTSRTPRSNTSQFDADIFDSPETTVRERWVFYIDIDEVLMSDKNLYFIKKVSLSPLNAAEQRS